MPANFISSPRWFAEKLDSGLAIHFISGLALLLRLVALAFLAREPLGGDDLLYHDFALRVLHGKAIYPLVPPALGYYLAFFYRLFGTSALVARASMLPLAIAFLYALHAVAARFAGRKAANLAVLIFAIYPLYVLCSVEPITEMPAALLLLVCLLLALAIIRQPRFGDFALLGLALGFLILTRPSAMLLLAWLPLYLAWKSRKWLSSAAAAFIPLLMIGLCTLGLYRSTGHFVMINFSSTQNVFLGNNAYTPLYRTWWFASHGEDQAQRTSGFQALNAEIMRLPWYEQNAFYRRTAWQSILARPNLFAIRTLNRARAYFAFDSYTGSLLLNRYSANRTLAFAAIAVDAGLYLAITFSAIVFLFSVSRASERFWPTVTILASVAAYAGPYFLSVAHPIYHFPIVPLIALFAAACWSDLLDGKVYLRRTLSHRGVHPVAMTLAVALFAYIQVEYAVLMYLFSSH